MENILIALAIVVLGLFIIGIVVTKAYKSDEKDNLSVKYVLVFNTRTKKFYEDRSDEHGEEENEEVIAVNNHSVLDNFNHFCAKECYHITTIYQARKVFDIYLHSRECQLEGHAN